VSIGSCRLVGLDGTHGTGKTSAALALTAELCQRGIRARYLPEVVRTSPYFEKGRLAHPGPAGELDVFGEQIASEQRAAVDSEVLVCDRTLLSAVAYWQVRVPRPRGWEAALLGAAMSFVRIYVHVYDAVFLLNEPLHGVNLADGFRQIDPTFQAQAADAMTRICDDLGVIAHRLPSLDSADATLSAMVAHLTNLGYL